MDSTAEIVWHAFLQSSPPDRQRALLHCLSPEMREEFERLPKTSTNPRNGMEPIEVELSQIHFSWFAPFLRSLSENEIKLFMSCLGQEQIKGLKQSLLLSNTIPNPSSIGKIFLRKTLFELIATPNLLPTSYLPTDPLDALLDLSYDELCSLIDLLSMHDLSIEIRQIIETAKLKEIYSLLTKAQTTFLKTLLHKKETVSFKKIGLANWREDREGLRSLLMQRGINRIAKALYPHHPSLLWHIAHRLDSERGQALIHLCTALDHPRAAALLSEQVIELVNALKNNNPPQGI